MRWRWNTRSLFTRFLNKPFNASRTCLRDNTLCYSCLVPRSCLTQEKPRKGKLSCALCSSGEIHSQEHIPKGVPLWSWAWLISLQKKHEKLLKKTASVPPELAPDSAELWMSPRRPFCSRRVLLYRFGDRAQFLPVLLKWKQLFPLAGALAARRRRSNKTKIQ